VRNIKFRLWDGYEKRFLPYPCFFNHLDFNEFTSFDRWFKCDEEKVTVQECTGLKDKDGKEIFEGDIVEFSYEENGTIFKGRVECFTDRASFGIVTGNAFTTFDEHLDYMHLFQVIGNIFENPDLVEKTQV
jgi:uncharacterized phage protein (TIGR01671 family)